MPYFSERVTGRQRLQRLLEQAMLAGDRRDRLVDTWQDTYNIFRTESSTSYDPGGFQLQANFPFAWYESMRPSIVFENPVFTCEAMSQESEESVPTVEAAVTAELKSIKFKKTLKRVAFDALLYGVGVWQLGYYEQGLIPSTAGGKQPDTPVNVVEEGPKGSSDLPYGIKPGQIYAIHIRPYNFYIDPTATCIEEALYCGVEYIRDLEAVKADPQYKKTENLQADETDLPRGMKFEEFREKFGRDPERKFVRLFQHWDLVDRKVYTFAKGHETMIAEQPMRLPVDRFPFYIVQATDDNEDFWCQGPMEPWLNLVEEYNVTISRRLDHLDRFMRKYAYDKTRVSEEEVEALRNPVNGTLIGVESNGQPVRGAIEPIPEANISNDSYAFTSEMNQRRTEISGVSEFDLGGTRPGERPAAEINRISGAANARRSAIAERFQSTLETFAGDVRSVMERYYTKQRIVRVTGDQGETVWAKYDGSALAGEYLFSCQIEDMAATTKEERLSRAAQILQVLAPFSQIGGSPQPMLDIKPPLKRLARELGAKDIRFLPQSSPPMDPGREWFLMLKKGAELIPNEIDDHEWHLFSHLEQLEHAETLKSPSTSERLATHMEAHRAMLLARQTAEAGQQKQQQAQSGAGGQPGPNPGTGNNPGGGAGVFAGGGGNTPQGAGTTGQNIQELLRGGF